MSSLAKAVGALLLTAGWGGAEPPLTGAGDVCESAGEQSSTLADAIAAPPDLQRGLAYRYHEGTWRSTDQLQAATPRAHGRVDRFSLDPRLSDNPSGANAFGFIYDGYIEVPEDGEYQFYTESDDGSRLWIGDTLVVDNDGPHAVRMVQGSIGLRAGLHPIRVAFFENWGAEVLRVAYQTPGGFMGEIPASALYHGASQLPPLADAVAAPPDLQSGLAYAFYEGRWQSTDQLLAATPRFHGRADRFGLDPRSSDNPPRGDTFGIVYDGYIEVPEDGYYEFSTSSDDGSRLWIGDTLVVDNDGLHAQRTVRGGLGLKAGLHPIRVAFFEYFGDEILRVAYRVPGGTLAEIPVTALHHAASQLPAKLPSVELPASARPGVAYRYHEGNWSALPDFAALTPAGLGAVANFTLETASRRDLYGFRFDGYLLVPAEGFYDFYTSSDDGSRLYIDDRLVTNNDGLHSARDERGTVGLAAGWHRIRVDFFECRGADILTVSWNMLGGQRSPIPDAALAFDPASLPALHRPAASPAALVSGLQYAYYEWTSSQSAWTVLPDFARLTPVTRGTVDSFSLAPRLRSDRYAFRYTGYIDVPEYGYYTFFTASDDGSRLYIDNTLVVDNDGLHSLRERSGQIGLERGRHAIAVDFFEWTGDDVLTVSYAGPHFAQQPLSSAVLFRLDPSGRGDPGDPGAPEGPRSPAENSPPSPALDRASTGIGAGQSVLVDVLANDGDPDGDIPLLLDVKPDQGHGVALVDRTLGKLIYYPPLGFVGDDRLTYTISDRRGGTAEGQLAVQVGEGVRPLMSAAEAARLLTQATFGPTKASLAEVMQKGAEAWLDEQLALPATLHAPALDSVRRPGETPSLRELRVRAWLDRAAGAPDQLRQRVAFALSQILVVSDSGNALGTDVGVPGAADYYDLLVRSAFGAYRPLLGEVTLHPAMGLFLNMAGNRKADPELGTVPDENYAREILQLFSVGLWELDPDGQRALDEDDQPIPSYGTAEVMELAKVFTGWSFAAASGPERYRRPMVLDPSLHDDEEKVLLGGAILPAGQGGEADLEQALDSIAAHPNVAPFLARQLIQRLVTSNPSPAYIARVADAFRASGLNLGVAVKALLLDPEARTAPAGDVPLPVDGKTREPLLQLTALWRGLGINPAATRVRLDQIAPLGQVPLSAPSVFNFFKPDYQSPGTIASLGLYSPELEILTEKQVMGAASVIDDWTLGGRQHYDLNMELAFARATADKALDHLDLLFLGRGMSGSMRQVLANTMFDGAGLGAAYSDPDRLTRMLGAVYLIVTSPEFQTQR